MSQSAGYFRAQVLLRYHYASNLNWDFSECRCQWPDLGVYFHRPQSERGIEKSEVNMWSKQ